MTGIEDGSVSDGLRGAARARAMAAVGMAVLLSALDYAVANVALPVIARDLHTTAGQSIWVVNAYQITSLVALLPVASLGEIAGFARLCRIGLAVFVLASALCALSPSLLVLTGARVLQGVGGACIMGVNAALVRFIYPQELLGRGIALNGLILAVGIALGPTVSAAILAVAPWPWLFWINLPLGGAALALACTSLPATPRTARRFDGASAALLAVGIAPVVVGLDEWAHRDSPLLAAGLVATGIASLSALVRREHGRAAPLLPVDLLLVAPFRTAFVTAFTAFIASNLFIVPMPFLLEGALRRDVVATGLIMSPWAVAVACGSFAVGRIADRAPIALVSAGGLVITGTGFVLLRVMPSDAPDWAIAARIALAGFGFGVFQPPNNRAMLLAAPIARAGSASGMMSASRLFGQTMGAVLVAILFDRVWGKAAPLQSLGCAAGIAFLAAALSASRALTRKGKGCRS